MDGLVAEDAATVAAETTRPTLEKKQPVSYLLRVTQHDGPIVYGFDHVFAAPYAQHLAYIAGRMDRELLEACGFVAPNREWVCEEMEGR